MSASQESPADGEPPAGGVSGGERREGVAPGTRFVLSGLSWLMLAAALPGIGRHHGFGHLAFIALVPWALSASRPGRRAFLAEWAAASIGLTLTFLWMRKLLPGLVPIMGLVPALWPAAAGLLLRRLSRRFPLAVAVPVAWMAGELARWLLPVPLTFGWWRLGVMAHDSLWFAGSARVFGIWGLSYVFAAFAGAVADALRARELEAPWSLGSKLAGFGPLAFAIAATFLYPAPETRPGPSVMIVQPGIEQKRKTWSKDPFSEVYLPSCNLTRSGLAELEAAGEPPPDLIGWGESMLIVPVYEDSAIAGVREGLNTLPWTGRSVRPGEPEFFAVRERELVQGFLFGDRSTHGHFAPGLLEAEPEWGADVLAGQRLIPEGTSFFSGAESVFVHEGAIRRRNAGFLWDSEGRRGPPAPKVTLVPGAEDMRGLHRVPFLLDMMLSLGGYVPDLVPAERTEVLTLDTRSGESFALGATICYDNAFDVPYTEPVRRTAVDFHLVASNEAWYEQTVEMDQMAAFSRLIAQATGRSIVRVANSGISMVIDPGGAEVATIEVDGRRKMVGGTLTTRVPVPVRDGEGRAPKTIFVRTELLQLWGWAGLILALWARAGRSPGRSSPRS